MHSNQDLEQCTKIAELVSFQTLHILKATDGHPCGDKIGSGDTTIQSLTSDLISL
jgi:hypothetical protein